MLAPTPLINDEVSVGFRACLSSGDFPYLTERSRVCDLETHLNLSPDPQPRLLLPPASSVSPLLRRAVSLSHVTCVCKPNCHRPSLSKANVYKCSLFPGSFTQPVRSTGDWIAASLGLHCTDRSLWKTVACPHRRASLSPAAQMARRRVYSHPSMGSLCISVEFLFPLREPQLFWPSSTDNALTKCACRPGPYTDYITKLSLVSLAHHPGFLDLIVFSVSHNIFFCPGTCSFKNIRCGQSSL